MMERVRSAQRDDGTNSVVGRAVAILTSYLATDRELTLAELTRRTGLPKPTVHRLLHELATWGLVERTGSAWRLGLQLFELGQMAPRQRTLHEAALPFLHDLHEATHETVHMAVLDGTEIVYIDKLSRRGAPTLPSRVGGRMPLHCTAVGKVWLAYSSPGLLRTVIANGLERRTSHTVLAPGRLAHQLTEIRREGVGFDLEESTDGVVCVACPVLDHSGQPVAAISVSGRLNRLDVKRMAPALRTTVLGLSRQLGGGAVDTGS